MRKQVMFLTAAVALASGVAMAGPADWTFAGSFGNPPNAVTAPPVVSSTGSVRLAVDSTGKLYVTTNPTGAAQSVWYGTAPTTTLTTPTYTLLTQFPAEELNNGFQGISVDAANNVYVSGDDGAGTIFPSKLQKFDSTGAAVAAFGTAGTVAYPNTAVRFTGNDVFSNGNILVVNVHGTTNTVFNSVTGAEVASWNGAVGTYPRDVAIKQDTVGGNDEIFFMKSGKVVKLTGGTAAAPAGYTTVTPWEFGGTPPPFDTSSQVRPGIGYFANDDTLIHGNYNIAVGGTENSVYVVEAATGNVIQILAGIYRASDCAVYTSAGVDYLYVTTGTDMIQVFSKPTTPAAAVNEWSLY